MFFDSWYGLVRVLTMGVLAYFSLILMLRFSGKRTLSKMNAFDLVVTIALGSTLATILLSKDIALAEGIMALAVLISLQYVVAKLASCSKRFQNLVKSEPRLLLSNGQIDEKAISEERITREEVYAAMRSTGIADKDEAAAVILETDGSFSVIRNLHRGKILECDNPVHF